MAKSYIYKIAEPSTGIPFYVGQTADLKARMAQHATHKSSLAYETIQKIKERGLKAMFIIIEECALGEAYHKEQYWIKKFRDQGVVLLNKERPKNKHFDIVFECELTEEVNI